jgi:signal transduction histidine kinase
MKVAKSSVDLDLIAAIEREQRLIGYELHDNLCQTLAGTSLILKTIGRAVAAQEPVTEEALGLLTRILETAITQVRALSRRFTPVEIEGAGLMKAFEELAAAIPNCKFTCEKAVFIHRHESGLALFRVAQEAVNNAVQHAGAASIHLVLKQRNREIILRVKDNGCGFQVPKNTGAVTGLQVMRRRAEAVGGSIQARSITGRGTTIVCRVPAPRGKLKGKSRAVSTRSNGR